MNFGVNPLRILYVITTLDAGGAERCLQQTLEHLPKEQFVPWVLCLKKNGVIGQELQAKGFKVIALGLGSKEFKALHFLISVREMLRFHPDILHAWMYHGIAFSSLLRLRFWKLHWFWSIHNKDITSRGLARPTRLLAKLLARLSFWPTCIIYNSDGARQEHEKLAYSSKKSWVLRNGYNLTKARVLSPQERQNRRKLLGWPENAYIVGYVSRCHPQKDVDNFLKAAQLMLKFNNGSVCDIDNPSKRKLILVCLGQGFSDQPGPWQEQIGKYGLADHVICREWLSPIEPWMEAFDLLMLSSIEESLPNVLGEAMVCGVPWVSTDVGEVRALLTPPCQVVPREDPEALALASWECLQNKRESGKQLRQFIEANFGIQEQQRLLQEGYRNCLRNGFV